MRNSKSLVIALCGLICVLMLPASAGAEPGPGDLPDECTFEEGDLGRYIVVFHDWVEDPEAVAREQVERYGGNLGFVYRHALKGYSAEFLPESAEALQAEPTVKYVEVDHLIWVDESSGVIQWRSCPAAPPLGPPPTDPIEEPEPELPIEEPEPELPVEDPEPELTAEEPEQPTDNDVSAPTRQTIQLGTGDQQGEEVSSQVNRCGKGKVKRSSRCVLRARIQRGACKKLKRAGRRSCLRGAKAVGAAVR